ncbi:DUF6804 family protein [Moraxella catarrhalis]|uniref:DUF6804 family protein n=1 Tax=Moraxella catarrhalis TaxID=480 RepID=UPI00128B38EF|nr:DUF6804 family protein [Moraxella catarrhalis]MPY08939.1 hypothetical protein [Moraxella catarrhalis]
MGEYFNKRNGKRCPKQYITVGFLVLAVLPLSYSYYTLLRLIAFGVFGWAAYISFVRHEKILPWIFIVLALVYNPIIQVYFPNEIWIVINLLSVAFLVFNQRKFLELE